MTIDEEMVLLIQEIFERTHREWKVSGEYVAPSEEQIEFMLQTAAKIGINEMFESGGLIVSNDEGHLDVYVHVGTLDNDD